MNEYNQEQLASLIEENMGLVVLIVNSFSPNGQHELDEFIQLGRIGLWKAIIKHDPSRAKLSTLIWHYVRWEIFRHIYKEEKHKHLLELNDSLYSPKLKTSNFWEIIPEFLSEEEKQVINLKLEGYAFIEIGKKMGYPRGWANNIFKSAVNKIVECNAKKEKNINLQ